MINTTLYSLSDEMRQLLNMLESGEALDENGQLIPVVAEQLILTKQDLEKKAKGYGYVLKSIDDDVTLVTAEIERLNGVKKHLSNIKEKMTEAVKNAMIEFDMPKIASATLTLQITTSKAVEINDMNALPDEFKRTKIIIEPDKLAIKDAINQGERVKGAEIVEKKHLKIK